MGQTTWIILLVLAVVFAFAYFNYAYKHTFRYNPDDLKKSVDNIFNKTNENDVDIQLDRNVLTISSKKTEKIEKKAEKCDEHNACKNDKNEEAKKADEPKWLLRERKVCGFSRSFSLPNDANGEEISASFKNGILTVVIPRKAVNVPKRIEIKVA